MTAAFRNSFSGFDYSADGIASLTKPSGTGESDYLLAAFVNNDGARTLDTQPSGFATLHDTATTTAPSTGGWLSSKVAGASEGASYDFAFSDSFNGAVAMLAYQDNGGLDVSGEATLSGILSTPYAFTAPSITTTVDDTLNIIVVELRFTTVGAEPVWTPPSGYTSRLEVGVNYDNRALAIFEKTQTTAGASGTAAGSVAVTGGGDARVHVYHLALKPATTSYKSRPASDVSDGTWTASDAGPDLYAMLDEETPSDADYITASAAGTCEVALATIAAAPSGWQTTISYRIQGDCTVSLREGSTERAGWTHSPGPGTPTTYVQTLTSGEQAAITDWSNLRLRFVKP